MPKRTDIKKILLIGSGPIIIGQACEFDYSGTQACKALREEGYKVVLVTLILHDYDPPRWQSNIYSNCRVFEMIIRRKLDVFTDDGWTDFKPSC
jgi:hypothetical protein